MKYDNIRAFEKHLEDSASVNFSNIYAIMCKEEFECKQALDILLNHLVPDMQQQSLYRCEGHAVNLGDLMTELNSISFLVQKRAILIQNADKLPKNAQEALEAYMKRSKRSNYLILVCSALNKNTSFYKTIEKEGVVLEAAEIKPWDKEKRLLEWLSKQMAAARKVVSQQACRFLVNQTGCNQALLAQEVNKLLCYIGDRKEITHQEILMICTQTNYENMWQLGEAIFQFDAHAAVRICQSLLSQGQALLPLMRHVRNQFQTGYQISLILAQGGQSSDITKEFPYMKGQILERHIRMAQQYGVERFKQGLMTIDETEMKVKNSQVDDELVAELLMMKLSHPNYLGVLDK